MHAHTHSAIRPRRRSISARAPYLPPARRHGKRKLSGRPWKMRVRARLEGADCGHARYLYSPLGGDEFRRREREEGEKEDQEKHLRRRIIWGPKIVRHRNSRGRGLYIYCVCSAVIYRYWMADSSMLLREIESRGQLAGAAAAELDALFRFVYYQRALAVRPKKGPLTLLGMFLL